MPTLSIEPIDDELIIEACETFSGGQNSFTRAALLAPNQAALLENVVILISGEIKKRLGTRNVYSGYVAGANQIVQSLLYFDSVIEDRLIAFAGGTARYFDGLSWQDYFPAAITDINERIDSVQLTDLIYWTDSNKTGIRLWDGATVDTVTGSPIATILETHTGRLVASGVSSVPDGLYFSEILDGETWDLVNDAIRIGGGKGDPIVAVRSGQENLLIVLCRQSAHIIDANPETAVASMVVKKVHNSVGCVAKRSVCQVGQDVWFLSRNGVMSIQKQLATSTNMIAVPMSQPIQDVVQNIRWDHAYKSAALCYNNFYLLSVPVDSNEPDTVIAFHYLTGGFAIFKGLAASVFIEQPFEGTTRAIIGCDTGEVRQWLEHLHEDDIIAYEDYKDGVGFVILPQTLPFTLPLGFPTTATIITRAMTFGDPLSTKSGYYLEVEFIQGDGTAEIYAILDGEAPILLRSYTFSASSFTLPTILPFTLPIKATWVKRKIPLHHLNNFYELQIKIVSLSGSMSLRRIAATAMLNAYRAQENQ